MPPAKSRRPVQRRRQPHRRSVRPMSMGFAAPAELGAVVVVLVAGALLFWRGENDQFTLLRATVVVATALVMAITWATRGVEDRRWPRLPRSIAIPAGAVLALLTVSAFIAPLGWTAVLGPLQRSNGLALYLACGVLLVAASQLDERAWRLIANVVAVLLGIVAAYGVLQWLGSDPFSWPGAETSTIFSTFGQSNFASGWVAMMLPFALLATVDSERAVATRVAGAGVAVLSLLFLRATGAFQGLPAAAAGAVPLGYVIARRLVAHEPARGRRIVTIGLTTVIVVVLAAVLIPSTRHAIRSNIDSGLHERQMLWEAGGRMVRDAPLIGKGVASYGVLFHRFEPAQHAIEFGDLTADAPHSVPLEMAVSGGLLLAVAYLAFIVMIGVRLVVALRRSPTLLLAAVGGAWFAYQVQAAVSLDVPPLATAHWILAGGIVALTTDLAPAARSAGETWSRLGLALGAAVMVATSPWLTRPLRADIAIRDGLGQLRSGRTTVGVATLERATRLAPWNSVAWADLAGAYQVAQRPDDALAAGAQAVRRNPGSIRYRTSEAKLAALQGKTDIADRYYRDAMANQPANPAVSLEAAAWAETVPGREGDAQQWYLDALRHARGKVVYIVSAVRYLADNGAAGEAIGAVRAEVQRQPDVPELRVALGDLLLALGKTDDARTSFERALELSPNDPVVRSRIASLDSEAKQ